jgi:hypothetical protein
MMSKRAVIAGLSAAVVAMLALPPSWTIAAQAPSNPSDSSQALAEAELRDRGAKLIANQHKDDEALDRYERIEHELDSTGGPNSRTLDDKKIRLVPNGAGTTKLLLEENGRTVSPDEYRRELQNWLNVLQFMVNPNDDRMKSATAKYLKKNQSRAELVDTMLTAFTRKWVGRETRDGHDCDVIELTPDPNFHPHSIAEGALAHANARIWVDRNEDQLVRGEAHVTSDIWFGGGVLGKLYKGGTFVLEQTEVAPGVWLPARYQFDFSGREFLFSIERHEGIEATQYHYVGSAKDALIVAQSELASAKPIAGDP